VQRPPDPTDVRRAAQARTVGIVLAGTIILWMGAQVLGSHFGWETRYVFLFDLAAIAGFLWALVVTYQIWRGRRG
jgi:Family of unknown function (DUF5337)